MNSTRIVTILIPVITLSLAACGAETLPVASPSPTTEATSLSTIPEQAIVQPATSTRVPTFTRTPSPEPTPSNTPVPTITPTPSPTPEPEPVVTFYERLTTRVNVRAGPGTDYPVIGKFKPGDEATVTGRNEDSSWWQVSLDDSDADSLGWVYGELGDLSGNQETIPIVAASSLASSSPPDPVAETKADDSNDEADDESLADEALADESLADEALADEALADEALADEALADERLAAEEALAEKLRCGKDFCVTYQAMVPMWENGGCVGNHSIYITVLEGLPPGKPMDGVVIGDTYDNVEVASGSHGPGHTEITLWMNSMTLIAKRNMDGTPYTSEESFNFTAHDELIPADVLAANGYCGGSVEQCEQDRNHNGVCRGHYSWRVTFHKFD